MALLLPLLRAEETAALRVTSSMGGTMRRGQSISVTWTVTGTTDPIRLLLDNKSKAIGMLEGGDVQLVTTSGGSPNTVSRNVTALNPGAISIEVEIEPGRNASAVEIASTFHKELQRIASWLEKTAKELPVERTGMLQRKTVRLDDVLDLLDHAEADVRRSLPYRELMPFQDAVTERMENFRRELTGVATAEVVAGNAEINLVRERTEARVRQETAHSFLVIVAKWIRSLGAASPITTVCFRMVPANGASIELHPASFPSDRQSAPFVSPLTLYLGRYVYEVTRSNRALSGGVVNLLVNPNRVLECPSSSSVVCGLVEGSPENCR
jgi:hypothetical protein